LPITTVAVVGAMLMVLTGGGLLPPPLFGSEGESLSPLQAAVNATSNAAAAARRDRVIGAVLLFERGSANKSRAR
jgi:hypothetical protein